MNNIAYLNVVTLHGYLLVSVIILTIPFLLIFAYRKLRPRFPIEVECWFCGRKGKVPYGNRNCWDCLYCEQYNGFQDDGDYNKPIPAQYDENLNFPVMGVKPKENINKSWLNGLCRQCNANQVVKIKMLSSFVPISPEKEDEEYRNYIHHLDKLYSLCWHCDIHTHKFLSKQDSILRNSLPPNYNLNSINTDAPFAKLYTLPKATFIFWVISLLSLIPLFIQSVHELQQTKQWVIVKIPPFILNYMPQNPLTLFIGFISTTLVIGLIGKERWHINDALLTMLWVALQIMYSDKFLTEYIYHQYIVFTQPIMILFIGIFSSITYYLKLRLIFKSQRNRITTFKLQKSDYQSSLSSSSLSNTLDDSFSSDSEILQDPLSPLDASFNAVHITPPNQRKLPYQGDIGYEFEISHLRKRNNPGFIVRPARFNPRSITHSSWVAGGFWSQPSSYCPISPSERTAMNFAMAGYQSSGLFTPPPSVTGSQESRATSAAGSYYSGDWHSSSAASVRSWPPSYYSEKLAQSPYTPSCRSELISRSPSQASGNIPKSSVATMTPVHAPIPKSRVWMKILISLCLSASVLGNFVFLNYFISWPLAISHLNKWLVSHK